MKDYIKDINNTIEEIQTKEMKANKYASLLEDPNYSLEDLDADIKKIDEEFEAEMQKGTGVKGRGRKKRGGNVVFFNDAKQLLKKLELIVGEIIAGNTSINMRNMGVNILDTLFRMSTINRPQYNKLYNQYFKI